MREQFREEAAGDLDDRDYRIMSMMAEGLKPILDRLEEIDDRVAQMEDGNADLPEDPRGWLSTQLADTFRGGRGDSRALARNPRDIEARLPQMIEQAVTERFEHMAGKLQQEIEETHVKTLETFVKNVQVKLVQRVSSLEQDMARHTQAMHQLRDSSQRTEDNLSRLITGVDKLAQELPRRIAAATAAQASHSHGESAADASEPRRERAHRRRSTSRGVLMIWGGIAGLLVIAAILYFGVRTPTEPQRAQIAAGGRSASPAAKLPPGADTKTKMRAAQEYADRKEYSAAEEIYKQVIQAEPDNKDALKALASVLYREDKLAESAAVLDKIR
jgi:tetratricopeptide (TPR) repeat protein